MTIEDVYCNYNEKLKRYGTRLIATTKTQIELDDLINEFYVYLLHNRGLEKYESRRAGEFTYLCVILRSIFFKLVDWSKQAKISKTEIPVGNYYDFEDVDFFDKCVVSDNNEQTEELRVRFREVVNKMDELNRNIIEILLDTPNAKVSRIARKLHINTKVIEERINDIRKFIKAEFEDLKSL